MSFSIIKLIRQGYAPSPRFINTRSYARWNRKLVNFQIPFEAADLKEEEIITLDSKILERVEKAENPKAVAAKHESKFKEDLKKVRKGSKKVVKTEENQLIEEKSSKEAVEDVRKTRKKPVKIVEKANERNNVFDETGAIVYEKLGRESFMAASILTQAKSKKIRTQSGQILLENWRLIAEGLMAGCKLEALFFSQVGDAMKLQPFLPKTGPKLYKIPYKEIQMWSYLDTSPGIMGVFEKPDLEKIPPKETAIPLNIICDNVRDPGNLGSILRSASAAGAQRLLLTKGCVDLWDPKVVRSAAGAHFQMAIQTNVMWQDCANLIGPESSFCIADNKIGLPVINNLPLTKQSDDELPYEMKKLKYQSIINQDKEETNGSTAVNDLAMINIPTAKYYEIDFLRAKSVTLAIGGETEGVSEECYLYASLMNGTRLNIPMSEGVDSLNAGTALAIIAFEIRKQITSKQNKSTGDSDRKASAVSS